MRHTPARRTALLLLAGLSSIVILGACNAIWGIDQATLEGADGGPDARSDVGPLDALGDRGKDTGRSDGNPGDAPREGDVGPSDTGTDGPFTFDGHCPVGGGIVKLAFDPAAPKSLATDDQGLYWANFASGTVGTLPFGSSVGSWAPDASMTYPEGIVAVAGKIVVLEVGVGTLVQCDAPSCTTALPLTRSQPGMQFIAANSSAVFWTTSIGIETCDIPNCSGGARTLTAIGTVGGLAADDQNVYWTDTVGIVHALAVTAGTPINLAVGETNPGAIVVGNGSVYWATLNAIRTCVLGGGLCGRATTLVGNLSQPGRLAVDAENLYYTESSLTGSVSRVSLDGGAPEGGVPPLVAAPEVEAIALGKSCLFWSEEGDAGAVYAAPK